MPLNELPGGGRVIGPPKSQKLKAAYVVLRKGQEIGEHTTGDNEELIIILNGIATIFCEQEEIEVPRPYTYYVPYGKKHNVRNDYDDVLVYMYVTAPIG